MKRSEILSRLGFNVPDNKKKRVILVSDIHCEADDPFAIMQHLLSPSFDVKGIIACHYEWQARLMENISDEHAEGPGAEKIPDDLRQYFPGRGESRDLSYSQGETLLKLAQIDDIPLLKGSQYEMSQRKELPESEGADFIIREALKDDAVPLYVCTLGAQTDLGIALRKCPEIAEKLTVVCILGGEYPHGGWEFNCIQDVEAVNVILKSGATVWQIPMNVYSNTEISFAELVDNIRPCGELGKWMVDQMLSFHAIMSQRSNMNFPNPEVWSIGDNPTAGVLLQSADRRCWHEQKAPHINPDGSYSENPEGKTIRVYDWFDNRLTIHDLISKMRLCYLKT